MDDQATTVRVEGEDGVVGVTDFFQAKIGDIAYVDPVDEPSFEQDDVFATLESIKATLDLTIPASGEVIAFNLALQEHPERVSRDPYGEGWIVRLRLTDWEADQEMLLPAEAYFALMQTRVAQALEEV